MTVTPNQSGTYSVVCNEYCGIGHHTMVGRSAYVKWGEANMSSRNPYRTCPRSRGLQFEANAEKLISPTPSRRWCSC